MSVSLGKSADNIYAITLQIKELEAQISKLKSKRTTAETSLMNRMGTSEVATIRGTQAMASISHTEVFGVKDWDAFYKYISRYKAFDLLHKRASSTAIKMRIEDGKKVPGIKKDKFTKLSITKSKK